MVLVVGYAVEERFPNGNIAMKCSHSEVCIMKVSTFPCSSFLSLTEVHYQQSHTHEDQLVFLSCEGVT